ncbi:membrane-associated phosphatidylinositol transfer protein 1 isoform X3 [Lathamus discolor]|uniref:membrane-associated phosphatidylinositol transfer protein 1 isoform X3 n=1 Tax=Lathamus discolor TaxID=678569 RepID=UPI0032B7B888
MLIKEYRIVLPMSLDEYQVAQLYMIQKKSREESSGEGSGVEILANRPYSDGPGGSGQYTHKVYHVGSHIPSWFRALLPKAALQVEEESWNAYPYTRTRYTCPFVEKFSIEIETYYRQDAGQQPNVFNLSAAEKRQRILDTIDIVRDPISPGEYKPEEDPKLYHSTKTGRGPLGDDWLEAPGTGPLMCAYKLCKVEFRYWGMQSKIEQFIHDVGLRKVMLRAHRQAWCWQDEWTDLTMEDIRQLEDETAQMLAQKMGKCSGAEEPPMAGPSSEGRMEPRRASGQEGAEAQQEADVSPDDTFAKQWSTSSRSSYSSQHGGGVSPQSLSEWRMQNIARDSENSSEEEFFDAHEDLSDSDEVFAKEMTKWSSNDFLDTLEQPVELDEALGEGTSTAKVDGEALGTSSFSEREHPGPGLGRAGLQAGGCADLGGHLRRRHPCPLPRGAGARGAAPGALSPHLRRCLCPRLQAEPLQPRHGQTVQQPGPHPPGSPPAAGHLLGELPARPGHHGGSCQPGLWSLPALQGGSRLLWPGSAAGGLCGGHPGLRCALPDQGGRRGQPWQQPPRQPEHGAHLPGAVRRPGPAG